MYVEVFGLQFHSFDFDSKLEVFGEISTAIKPYKSDFNLIYREISHTDHIIPVMNLNGE